MDSDLVIRGLEVSVVLVFFVNKVLILAGKQFGWLFGIIAACAAILYFYSVGKIPLAGLQVGLLAAAVYGFQDPSHRHFVEWPVRVIIALVVVALAIFVLTGALMFTKSLVSAGILFGNYLLARSHFRIGWLVLGLGNAGAAYFGYLTGHIFFADFQMATAIVSFIGVISPKPKA